MICVNPTTDASRTVLVVSEKGYGKRTPVDEYRFTNRGGKGVKTISVTEKTGNLVGMLDVEAKEDLMITCKSGVTIRMKVAHISEQGRATQGVKLIRLDEGDEIAAITRLDEQDEEEIVAADVQPVEGEVSGEVAAEPAADAAPEAGDDATPEAPDASSEGENM